MKPTLEYTMMRNGFPPMTRAEFRRLAHCDEDRIECRDCPCLKVAEK